MHGEFLGSACKAISLVDRASHAHLYHLHLCTGNRVFLRRPLAEQERASRRRGHWRISLRPGGIPGKLLRQQARVALSELRLDWGYRSWIQLHCSHSGAGEKCRSHLWPDAHCLGFRERLWTFVDRAYATKQRLVCQWPPCDCWHHGGVDDSANPGVAAQIDQGRRRSFESRRARREFQMTLPSDAGNPKNVRRA